MTRLMLLDSNGLIYRGYHALPPLTTSKGELVNAVFASAASCCAESRTCSRNTSPPASICRAPPSVTSSSRRTRPLGRRCPTTCAPSSPRSARSWRRSGFRSTSWRATRRTRHRHDHARPGHRGVDTTVVTGDLDMLQIVTEHTRLMTTRQGVDSTVYYDPARIWERFELRPDQMIDYKALKGDPTDNIPGIPGVGEKTRRSSWASSARSKASMGESRRSSPTSSARSSWRRASRSSPAAS